jgi:hypothetical protein
LRGSPGAQKLRERRQDKRAKKDACKRAGEIDDGTPAGGDR